MYKYFMFMQNKYTFWYYKIITNSKLRKLPDNTYIEKHHIIPKCIGGNNSSENIAVLTAREHFIVHWLLTKMVDNKLKYKMYHALGRFVQTNNFQKRLISSRQYEIARKAIITARTGYKHSIEARLKMSQTRKGMLSPNKGKIGYYKHTEEAKIKIGSATKGKTFIDRYGQDKAEQVRNKISTSKIGKPSGMLGKTQSNKTKELISQNAKGKRGQQKRTDKCPNCNKELVTSRHIKFCKYPTNF